MPKKARKSSKSLLFSPDLQLGRAVDWPTTPDAAKLDRVPNPQNDSDYVVRFTAPELPPFARLPASRILRIW